MKGVFVPYEIQTSSIHELGETLKAWDIEGYEPIAIEVKSLDNETMIRVAAEVILSKIKYLDMNYLIARIGSRPGDDVTTCKKGQSIRVEECQPRVH